MSHKVGLLRIATAVCCLATFNPIALKADTATLTLTPAGSADFTLQTFADGFPVQGVATGGSTNGCCGALGIAYPTVSGVPTGQVMVTDFAGSVLQFSTDSNNQTYSSATVLHSYTFGNAVDFASSGGNIYMTQQTSNQIVQLNNDGTINHVVTSAITNPTKTQLLVTYSSQTWVQQFTK